MSLGKLRHCEIIFVKGNQPFFQNRNIQIPGFGQGIEGGVEYALNSFTRNLYKRMNDKFLGGIYQKKQDELEKLSKQENLEKPYKYSNYAIDIGVNGAKAFNLIKKGIIKRKRTE